ncbi:MULTISPECIES: 5'-methylthioadenosine/adenosylhomocysteine nucleosidase [unclassified Treponema]|uniref:5'-methylthioadenosine/adenosylhomocysteine nucleosidase n=1 Tax=unclassified Treponema TaxID=2638727 RepID=UPI0020A4517F|nr:MULTISPECIES: 5'-methylthioadenosine/adenosylhomocysteine nucleosidase [unclassified Treponema]UTC66634.1 5'-methylthioadenosine/adenosylhomocysteine nucleosidase [Treponema sp. OMZ 789]UTC69366.1 5'-methylthioadenosine/adenosylhomocysteine nucleosidase [Treponema sp. OMZ 790]UTC72081.1 5'-methylthioadenosine/adenosylhomocysteine nucleosidase [Treponema sp. OMZ 791]
MKIGIFGAEEQEVKLLKKHLVGEIRKIAGLSFFTGKIMEKDVVLVCSGIGKVNAALCCQILISEFKVDAVINTGAAGGLLTDLNVFDIVVSSEAVQHDVDAVAFGYPLGQVPMTKSPFWPADKKLKNLAVKAFKAMQKEHDDEHIKNLKLIEGRIASGDVFVSDEKIRAKIIKEFNPACVEMEGAAAAQVCKINKIPFLILRSISDTAGKDDAAKISYDVFSAQAAKDSSLLVLQMLKML